MTVQNEYDKETFFEEYAKMPRSRDGLRAAGEWHRQKPLRSEEHTSELQSH